MLKYTRKNTKTKRSNAHFDLRESRGGGKSAGKRREGSFRVVMVKGFSCVAVDVALR